MDRPEIDPAHDEDAVTPVQSAETETDDAGMGCKIGELRVAATTGVPPGIGESPDR